MVRTKLRWLTATAVGSLVLAASVTGLGASAQAASKTIRVAYMSYVYNSYDAPMLAAAKAYALSQGVQVTVYDAGATPATQVSELQDVLSTHKFQGVLLQPIYPPAEISAVQALIKAKIKVVNMDQILGTSYTNTGIQVKGLSGNVVFAPAKIGTQLGTLTNQACNGANPCKIALIHNYTGYEPDLEVTTAFKAQLANYPADSVVAEADGLYSPATAETKAQDIITANPGLNVIVGSDQDCEGAQTALQLNNVTTVKLVCYGASAAAVAGIKSGLWTADVAQLPATEGLLGMQMLIRAIKTGKPQGSKNPVAGLPDNGVLLASNLKNFTPEWPG